VVSPIGWTPIEMEWRALVGSSAMGTVYDAQGRIVRRWDFVSRSGSFAWDGNDDGGARVRNGLYFLRLASGGRTATLKVMAISR